MVELIENVKLLSVETVLDCFSCDGLCHTMNDSRKEGWTSFYFCFTPRLVLNIKEVVGGDLLYTISIHTVELLFIAL